MTNNGAKIKYLLDTNVLIGFSLWKPISLNLNKDFWFKLGESLKNDDWTLLDVVVGEIRGGDYDLINWLNLQKRNGLVKAIDTNNKNRAVEINNNYKMIDEITLN